MAKKDTDLTIEQYRIVLQQIACCCATLEQVLAHAIDNEDEVAANLIDAGKRLATYMGSMADNAASPGGVILGSHDRWNYGRKFATAGKEASHG